MAQGCLRRAESETAGDWHQCGTLLMKTLNAGMEVSNQTAAIVRRDQASLADWQAKVGESPRGRHHQGGG